MNKLWVFAGRSNEPLAARIAEYIDRKHNRMGRRIDQPTVLGRRDPRMNFNDGELYWRSEENIRGADVFLVQSTNQPDSKFKELCTMIHTSRMASAARVTAVIPYFGYARQDWKDKSRAPLSAARDVRELEKSGAHRLLLLDLHSNGPQNACAALLLSFDHLWARPVLVRYLREHMKDWVAAKNFVVAAPDLHAGKLARAYAEQLGNVPLVFVEKRRPRPGEAEVLNIVGDVKKRDVLVVDDMIDSGKTTLNAARALKDRGAQNIYALAVHAVFSDDAAARIFRSVAEERILKKVFVTDSIRHKLSPDFARFGIVTVSVAGLLGEAIWRIHTDQSVSSLFEE